MKTQFNLNVKGRALSFSLECFQRGFQVFVQTNGLRHPKCCENPSAANNPLPGALVSSANLSLKEEFETDLGNQVRWINQSNEAPSTQVFFDACCMACQQHISRCGRLFIGDMFTYMDVFAYILNTYYGQSQQQTVNMYLECTKVLGHALNQYVKCPGPYGTMMDFDTWARINNL